MKSLLFTFILLFYAAHSAAQNLDPIEVRLFEEDGSFSSDYENKIQKAIHHLSYQKLALSPNEPKTPVRFLFSSGIHFDVHSYLGGYQHGVFDLGNQQVLRIRLFKKTLTPFSFANSTFDINLARSSNSMKSYRKGYNFLVQHNIPVAKILSPAVYDSEFFVIEKLNIAFNYEDYIFAPLELKNKILAHSDNNKAISDLSPTDVLSKVDSDFFKFLQQTANLRNIGDFRANQLVYTSTRGWVLLDWDASHNTPIRKPNDTNVFSMDTRDRLINFLTSPPYPAIRKPGLPNRILLQSLNVIQTARTHLHAVTTCQSYFYTH